MVLSAVLMMSISILSASAQEPDTTRQYNFETSAQWSTQDSIFWAITDEKSVSGSKSLSYKVAEDAIFYNENGLTSIETGHTLQKVRTAEGYGDTYIVASSYDGIVMGIAYDGAILWKNELSGFMVHDIWCADITGDDNDEILIANADGACYCLDNNGKLMWKYHPREVPMYAVCVVEKDDTPYVVCGGFDLSIYYLAASGEMVKEIKSSTYSVEKPWGTGYIPPDDLHYANFLRPVNKADGTQMLVVHGSNNHMQGKGSLYMFDILAIQPFNTVKIGATEIIGEFRTSDADGDGVQEIVLGFSGHQNSTQVSRLNLASSLAVEDWEVFNIYDLGFGYSVLQPELINDGGQEKYMCLVGNQIVFVSDDLSAVEEKIACDYSFNDMWKDGDKIIMASAQSGGSCVHIFDTQNAGWKDAYKNIAPEGKIKSIIDNTAAYRSKLASYERPIGEREPKPVYLMTENTDDGLAKVVADNIRANYNSPIFLGGSHMGQAEDWDRSAMENEKYKYKRDKRRDYIYTQQQCIDHITPWYSGEPGIAYWGGHGNDPYMFQRETTDKILDYADGKKTVLIYPELEDYSDDFAWVMEDLFYPLADSAQKKNANIFVRTKHNFWQGNVYLPMWERVMDGEYPDVFVPSMEETTDKAMDISIAGRSGVWASGAVNDWGTRSVPDNASFDRSRQFSNQKLPSHFLRHIVYHIACGATYINNFAVNPDYMSFLWELIAKGALYVPNSNEIVSYSPVHLGMKEPDEHYMNEASSLKWSTFYNEDFENNNPFAFSRHSSTYMAGKNTEWDFSTYAGGVKDRRQNYLPPYPNGLVLITPPQNGVFAKTGVARGALKDHLHPIYEDILEEYITDGRHYYSSDGTQTFAADEYVTTIFSEIEEGAEKLPLTVSGEVAWVVAQTSPTNLRLTIIDGGYLNPENRVAELSFHTVVPTGMVDILDGKSFDISNPSSVLVDIPCGLFRFIDIEISNPL